MKHPKIYTLFVTCSLLAITGCGGTSGIKESLGMTRRAPDEFKVVSRPPLSVPPQFNLRPPSSTDASPTMIPADKQAESIIIGNPAAESRNEQNVFDLREGSADTAVTPVEATTLPGSKGDKNSKKEAAESGFMQNIGANRADPKVREELVQQKIAIQEKQEESSWWDVFSPKDKKDPLVNAKGESERIKTNKAENKPVTEGNTPEVKDKDRGLLGNVFGW